MILTADQVNKSISHAILIQIKHCKLSARAQCYVVYSLVQGFVTLYSSIDLKSIFLDASHD